MATLFYQTFYGESYLYGESRYSGTVEELTALLKEEMKREDNARDVNAANLYMIDGGRRRKQVFQCSLQKSKSGRVLKSTSIEIVEQQPPIFKPETYRIPDHNLAWMGVAIEKLARKAKRLGLGEVGFEIVGTEREERKDGTVDVFHIIKPLGEAPKLDGWKLAATLQHEDAGNVIRAVPGEELPATFRSAKSMCEHCGTMRNRKDTFVVRHDDGSLMQVGRSCLQDFLGGKSPHSLISWASYIADIDALIEEARNREASGSYRRPIIRDEFLGFVAQHVINDTRFISATVAREMDITSTASKALTDMFPPPPRKGFTHIPVEVTSEAGELVTAATAWLHELEAKSDYEHNLKIVAGKEDLTYRDTNIAASLIGAYKRASEKRESKERVARAGENSQHIGTIGVRGVFTAKLEKLIGFETEYGYMRLHKFMDAAGNVLVWKTGSNPGIAEGEEVTFKATVKDHDLYEGVKQTIMTRLAVQ